MTSYNTADLAQIKNIECFLLDMDGTIYLGDTVIDGTFDFLDILKKLNKKAMYITNNSSRATIQYVEKLKRLGIHAKEEDFFTSVNALVYHLNKNHAGASLFLLGTPVLEEYLWENGFTIIKEYIGELPLYHMDVYRLEDSNENIGIEEYFDKGGVTIIEWADIIKDILPEERLDITFKIVGENSRVMVLTPHGEKYVNICEAVI